MIERPIRILFTIPNFITAGSGRVLANIVKGLTRRQFEPVVCVLKRGGSIKDELEASGIQVLEHPFIVQAKPYVGLPYRAWMASKAFKTHKFDLWHSFNYSDDYTEGIIARLAGAKAWIYTKKSMMWGTRAWILRSLLATRIIVDNKDMPELFFNKFGLRKKVRAILHGIPLEQFTPNESPIQTLRIGYKIPDDALLVSCVAHLVPVKNHPTLLDAISMVDNVHLFLAGYIGDQNYFEKLKAQAVDLGIEDRVQFLGMVDEIPEFLRQMDVNVLISKKEAFGVAIIEAMATRVPCIVSDISGPRDIIEDGVSGLLVPPEDPTALAGAIGRLRDDLALRERFGAEARKRVESLYTIEREVAAHERLYLEIIGN